MKRICLPLFLAVLALALTTSAWSTAPSCPAKGKATCPKKEGAKASQCPLATAAVKPSTCSALKATCTAKRPTCGGTPPKVMVKEKEGWKLVVHILQPGTRSQGSHGTLYKDNERVEGKKEQRVETPFGTFTWKGSMEERAHLWDATGWVCEDGNTFQEEGMPDNGARTSLDELDKQIDAEMIEKEK